MSGTPDIWVISPGGRDATGGICRMVDEAATAWGRSGGRMRVIDSGGMARGARMVAGFIGALLTVGRACAGRRVSLLHVHVAANGSVARKAAFVLLGRALRVPVVLHLHGADFETFFERLGAVGRRLVRAVFRRASMVVVLGARSRAHMIDRVGVDRRSVAVLANAVTAIAPRAARAPGCWLLFLGALTERKGLAELFEALASPGLAGLDWSLDLVGNGDAASVAGEMRRFGLGARVRVHGWLASESARSMLGGSDLLVLPSRQEALPMAILEAMAAGVAVVATDVGDVGDAVIDGVTGALVPARDPAALARALSRLIASPGLRDSLGRSGRARFERMFDIETYPERLAAIFARAMTDRGTPRLCTRAGTETP